MDDVAAFLEQVAEVGDPAPATKEIADAVGANYDSVEHALRKLRRRGVLLSENRGNARRFTIGGKQTGWTRWYVPISERPQAVTGMSESKLRQAACLRFIEEAADAGRPPPTSLWMANRLRVSDETAARAVRSLKQAGVIRIEGSTANRRITIVDSGKQTAWSGIGDVPVSPGNAGKVLVLLMSMADAGQPMPSFSEIAKTLNLRLRSVDRAMATLAKDGRIQLDTFNMQRRCIIAATGAATGFSSPGNQASVEQPWKNPDPVIPTSPRGGGEWPQWRTCQWIEGRAKERNFCGEATQEGSSYCTEHHARCYHKPAKEKGQPFRLFPMHSEAA
jgi:DNA-binding transcriptional regulator YhcF (GntR family)